MCTLFESPVNPMVAVLYKECKEECKFTDKSDSDFLLFLLNSAVRILNVVKDFSPLLEVSKELSPPRNTADHTVADKIDHAREDVLASEPGNTSSRISEYEDVLLERIEKSSDMETLQKYIDKVQRSIEDLPTLNDSTSGVVPDVHTDEVNELGLEDKNHLDISTNNQLNDTTVSEFSDLNGSAVAPNSEDILSDAISEISEILTKAHFDEQLSRKISLDINSLSRTDENATFTCTICYTHFKNQRNLSRHIRLGVCLEKNFNCKLCDHSFATEYGLKRHLNRTMCKKRAIGEENAAVSPSKVPKLIPPPDTDNQPQFKCELCNFSFATKAALTQHASSTKCNNNRIQGLASKDTKPPGFFQCPHCKSTLASKAGLAKHLKRAQCRVYQCPHCSKSFRYLHEVRTHRRLEHKDSDEMVSAVAKNFFNTMGGVPTMTYATNILNSISALPYLRGSQLDAAAHQCKVCSYAGTCKRSLENHMRMHVRQLKAIGENKNCTQCDYTSDDPDDLLKHYINTHPGLPYFKMAPKGTFIVRSNRMVDPTKTLAETQIETKTEGVSEVKEEKEAEVEIAGTSDEGSEGDDAKLELAIPLTEMPNSESEEVDCVSLNSQCIRESLEGSNGIACDI